MCQLFDYELLVFANKQPINESKLSCLILFCTLETFVLDEELA